MVAKLLQVLSLLFMLSCANRSEQPDLRSAAPAGLWADYKIWAEEGDSLATCLIQFYTGPEKHQTLVLQPPAGVQLDGTSLQVDSAGLSGAFYEYRAPVATFAGIHTIAFTDQNGRVFTDTLVFNPVHLASEFEGPVEVADQELLLKGIPAGARIRVVLTDTAVLGDEINVLDTVQEGRFVLPAAWLKGLKPGPVNMQLFAEEERHLRSGLKGKISVSYNINRMFDLGRRTGMEHLN